MENDNEKKHGNGSTERIARHDPRGSRLFGKINNIENNSMKKMLESMIENSAEYQITHAFVEGRDLYMISRRGSANAGDCMVEGDCTIVTDQDIAGSPFLKVYARGDDGEEELSIFSTATSEVLLNKLKSAKTTCTEVEKPRGLRPLPLLQEGTEAAERHEPFWMDGIESVDLKGGDEKVVFGNDYPLYRCLFEEAPKDGVDFRKCTPIETNEMLRKWKNIREMLRQGEYRIEVKAFKKAWGAEKDAIGCKIACKHCDGDFSAMHGCWIMFEAPQSNRERVVAWACDHKGESLFIPQGVYEVLLDKLEAMNYGRAWILRDFAENKLSFERAFDAIGVPATMVDHQS